MLFDNRLEESQFIILLSIAVLLPLASLFSSLAINTSGSPSSNTGMNVVIDPELLLLMLGACCGIFFARRRQRKHSHPHGRWLALMLCLFLWLIIANSVFRPVDIEALRQVKYRIVPAIMAYLFARGCLIVGRDEKALPFALLLGTSLMIVLLLLRVDFGTDIVRQQFDGNMPVGVNVVAVYSGISFITAVMFFSRVRLLPKILLVPMCCLCLIGMYIGGNRAIIYTFPILPFILVLVRHMRLRSLKMLLATSLVIISIASLAPGTSLRFIHSIYTIGNVEIQEHSKRLLPTIDRLWFDAEMRLMDQDDMLFDKSFSGFLFGMESGEALSRARYLAHAHNIFLALHVLGGIIGVGLFVYAMLLVLFKSLDALALAPHTKGLSVAESVLCVHVVLFALAVTNSWSGNVPIMVGIFAALTLHIGSVRRGDAAQVESCL